MEKYDKHDTVLKMILDGRSEEDILEKFWSTSDFGRESAIQNIILLKKRLEIINIVECANCGKQHVQVPSDGAVVYFCRIECRKEWYENRPNR